MKFFLGESLLELIDKKKDDLIQSGDSFHP